MALGLERIYGIACLTVYVCMCDVGGADRQTVQVGREWERGKGQEPKLLGHEKTVRLDSGVNALEPTCPLKIAMPLHFYSYRKAKKMNCLVP